MRAAIPVLVYAVAAAIPAAAQTPAPTPAPVSTPTQAPSNRIHHATTAAKPTGVPGVLGPMPAVPLAPPPVPVIPPPLDTAPPHPTAPPPPPPVADDAPGEASKIAGGLRVTFGKGRSDFNPATKAALVNLAQSGVADPTIVYNLYAHAPGTAEDTSTPRRLSLERALMVRSALINAGIGSIRIYVHAMGANGLTETAPADRVDIALATLDTSRPAAAPVPPAGTNPMANK
jgi:outer membrane protein OmpA-like peptidoglycan-associated protein